MRIVAAGSACTAAAIVIGLAAAATAAAEPSIYDPEISSCSHLFRVPWEPARPDTSVYWSPFGTANIVCVDAGYTPVHYYQQDPFGQWHSIEQLPPGNYFFNIWGYPTLPGAA